MQSGRWPENLAWAEMLHVIKYYLNGETSYNPKMRQYNGTTLGTIRLVNTKKQMFRKTDVSYSLIRAQGVRNFLKIFVYLLHRYHYFIVQKIMQRNKLLIPSTIEKIRRVRNV